MGRLLAVKHRRRSARTLGCALAAVVCFTFLPLPAQAQQAAESATLHGTVRDPQGKPIAAAIVSLQAKDSAQTVTAHTDSEGSYRFSPLREGVYALRAQKTGYSNAAIAAFFLGPKETKSIDLSLAGANTSGSQPATAQAPEFFDRPQFTIAGVTDTTGLGGHGSDTIVRTRETLAKETASLGKAPSGSPLSASAAAERALRERVEREPQSFEANHDLGKVLLQNGRSREAMAYLDRAGEINSGDYENAYDMALANMGAGNYDRAREIAQLLLPHHDTAEVHHLLGDVQEKLDNPLAAVREYHRAAELEPGEAYLFDWGSELLLHHAPEPAVEVFTQGNRLFPRSVRMLIGLGAAWFARGSYDQAVQRICEASDLNPDDSMPYRFMGKMQSAESLPSEDLVERLHRFVTRQPENAEASYYYAVGLWKRQKSPHDRVSVAQVESLLKEAIHLDPKFGAAYLQLGILHSEQGDFPRAISEYQKAVQAGPQMEEAHYRLAQAYRQVGEVQKAKTEIELYDQIAKESAQKVERERHEIRQFVYSLRDQPAPQIQ